MRLYHGSDIEVCKPIIACNTGFADLGQGFYLTDNREVARQRARSRARRLGTCDGVVSVFEFEEGYVPWACWGACGSSLRTSDGGAPFDSGAPFGLCFDEDREGIVAWVNYTPFVFPAPHPLFHPSTPPTRSQPHPSGC